MRNEEKASSMESGIQERIGNLTIPTGLRLTLQIFNYAKSENLIRLIMLLKLF